MTTTIHAGLADVLRQKILTLDMPETRGHDLPVIDVREDTGVAEQQWSGDQRLVIDFQPDTVVALDEAGTLVASSSALDGFSRALDDWLRLEEARIAELRSALSEHKRRKR